MCRWAFAKKNGHDYFIKQFISLKYPVETGVLSAETVSAMKQRADDFSARKQKLYQVLHGCRTGNTVVPIAFFREDAFFYLVTEKVSGPYLSLDEIASLNAERKWLLLSVIAKGFARIHQQGIVHSDIKPNNIMVKETADGYHTAKIIDFDESYFASDPPKEITGDLVYFAPEAVLYNAEERDSIDTRADVFAMGLLFHQYWCGKLPEFDHDSYSYACEALLEGSTLKVDDNMPDYLRDLIVSMLDAQPVNRPSSTQVFNILKDHRPGSFEELVLKTDPGTESDDHEPKYKHDLPSDPGDISSVWSIAGDDDL